MLATECATIPPECVFIHNDRSNQLGRRQLKLREKLENNRPKDIETTDLKEAICGVGMNKQELEEARRKKNVEKERLGLLTTEQLQEDFDKMYFKMKDVSDSSK